jgi:mannose-6-phosphate isomerase
MALRKLEPTFHERIWGTRDLAPWFPQAKLKAGPFPVGEVWFETPEIPLLVKFIFAAEKMSVQVHPPDDYARFHHNSPGKTEMWHVLDAAPGARIAAGFREQVEPDRVRHAAVFGGIEEMLAWHEAAPGDTFFIPAGTVHVIGGGLKICEIQQRSDITYRLYDYQRGRELHVDHAMAVLRFGPHQARRNGKIECEYFCTERLDVRGARRLEPSGRDQLLVAIAGEGTAGDEPLKAGEVVHLKPDAVGAEIEGEISLLRTYVP